VAQDAPGYQTRLGLDWHGSGQARLVHDPVYGAALLRVDWTGGPKTVELLQTVATRDRDASTPALVLSGADQQFWTRPSESLPTDGIVRDTAMGITAGHTTQRARLRAIYDWVVDKTTRDPHTPGCGTGDIRAMLQTGRLGGKCADINSLMTGLSRAAGLPARDVYGVRVAASRRYPSLGASGTVSKAQHCRSEIHLEDAGWFPVDPADVRKVMLEQHLVAGSAEALAVREQMFGSWEMNWIGYNSATDIVLPGAAPGYVPNFPFLMYPCAFTPAGQPDCLDPHGFAYEITSREVEA
jgi:transglutaminase-like putative cysteine protease